MTRSSFRQFVSRYRGAIFSSAYSVAMRIAGGIAAFALGVTLARVLGPAGYGVYGLITTLVALASTLAVIGTPQLAVRELSLRRAKGDWQGIRQLISRFQRATVGVSILIGVLAVACVAILSAGRGPENVYAVQAALLTLLLALTVLIAAELRGLGALLKGQFLDILGRPAVTLAATLVLVVAGWRLTIADALWIQVAVAAGAVVLSFAWIYRMLPPRAQPDTESERIPWLHAALPLAIVDGLRQLDGAYGVILMGWLASDFELGLFRVAAACAVIINMPITVAHVLFGPTASRLYGFGETAKLQKLLTMISLALVALILPTTIGIWFFGAEALELVFGAAYRDAWLAFFFVSCAQLVTACFGLGPTLLAMCDSERHLMRICALSVVIGIAAAIPLIDAYGAAGAGGATVISGLLIALFSQRFARRSLGLDPSILSVGRTL